MATLTLKNVPEALVGQLKEEAKQNRRSLNQEAIFRLERSLDIRMRTAEKTVAAVRRLHRQLAGVQPVSAAFVARAKRQGRP
jgi:hypothetical protein